MIAAGTGHRPASIGYPYDYNDPKWQSVISDLKIRFSDFGITKVISGMALGFDTALAIAAMQEEIYWTAAIPFVGQEKRWPSASKQLYYDLLDEANETVVVSPGGYAVWKMQVRNVWMVDNCDLLFAFWNGEPGGTCNCVEYAHKVGRQIERIRPV